MVGTRVLVAGPHHFLRLFLGVADGLLHYAGPFDFRRYRRHRGLLAEGAAVLDAAPARRRTLGPVVEDPGEAHLLGGLRLPDGILVLDPRVVGLAPIVDLLEDKD